MLQTIMKKSDGQNPMQESKYPGQHTDKHRLLDCYSEKSPLLCCLHLETENVCLAGNCVTQSVIGNKLVIDCVTDPTNNDIDMVLFP